ncbi:hypothetical protein HBH69_015670 [Parastagonospora nodorum]|nr:hypothetical protein HBI09_194810 [Parastagonospora nodorum]KAH4051222.1 hypothetical protein HBH49_114600 [Parastagonospora nodorum]KAH4140881.1 hypothetical protein HBH45_075470 [Parastagonospora nodorum]KAH4167684.1 hypothetical protein HBH44_051330 [Parastagonospora nodorum]KAH4642510.1 hypothetical protein HBH81_074830 [Parastagonospora nodorum]
MPSEATEIESLTSETCARDSSFVAETLSLFGALASPELVGGSPCWRALVAVSCGALRFLLAASVRASVVGVDIFMGGLFG